MVTQRTMTLSRAMKLKNRIVERMDQHRSRVQLWNSRKVETPEDYDVKECMVEASKAMKNLIALKAVIDAANKPIQRLLYEGSELRAHVNFLKGIPTRRGKETRRYIAESEVTEYVAILHKDEVDKLQKEAEDRLDEIQGQLDDHNSSTRVSIGLEN